MKLQNARRLSTALALLVGASGIAFAQDAQIEPGSERPMYAIVKHGLQQPQNQAQSRILAASTPLQTWNGSFSYAGKTYSYNMVGTKPSSNTSATVTTYVIPIRIVITSRTGVKTTYDPNTVPPNTGGKTAVANTVASPIFKSVVNFTSGGTSMGTTQYIDAYQRANFWGTGDTGSHLLLGGPTVLETVTLSPPTRYGKLGSVFGFTAGLVDINWFDAQLQTIMSNKGITPNTFPIFLTYNVYLTQNNSCCIGGYHSSSGLLSAPQSYAHATYVSRVAAFAQDVSALSHEVGEWADDPLVVNVNGNNTPCGILENGDPLENNANFGDFGYTVNGFTYNLQDLVTLPYFGAPPSTSVNGEFTFHGQGLTVCQNGS
ncbi:MAG TPA: hypothetical protein VN682_02455 [Terriglobales bacterium]|jgi:hypothetical protein|nr:hypothetical protein [Terriglobales bacterium]